jgi:para-aminobenzoate synthetase component 1
MLTALWPRVNVSLPAGRPQSVGRAVRPNPVCGLLAAMKSRTMGRAKGDALDRPDPVMANATVDELPYQPDSAERFAALLAEPWSQFLDSGRPFGAAGRYDILVADPVATLVTRGATSEIRSGPQIERSDADPFHLLRRLLRDFAPRCAGPIAVPFAGGAVGYLGYDLARRIERLPAIAEDAEHLPDLAVGLYAWALVVDHAQQRTALVWNDVPQAPSRASVLARLHAPFEEPVQFRVGSAIATNLDVADYRRAFERVQAYIRDGDCYQVNLARRYAAAVDGDPWTAYRRLRARNPSPFGAYLHLPFCRVLSASPERFLELRGDRVSTRPIKGTRPRAADPERDAALARDLAASAKDQAENLMIVDLLRNDLGKSCVPGSIAVPRLFEVEHHPTVHHLVSTVTGRLRPDRDALDLLRGCFPGGSVTGAPKLRAMQIIEELEPHRRGLYCGSIGYIGFDGAMDTNIAIRTLVCSDGVARFWAGGGIVADSGCEAEYRETEDKAAALLQLLEDSRE